jgi:hypothetical protein
VPRIQSRVAIGELKRVAERFREESLVARRTAAAAANNQYYVGSADALDEAANRIELRAQVLEAGDPPRSPELDGNASARDVVPPHWLAF